MAPGIRRKVGVLLSGLTACNSTLPLFILLATWRQLTQTAYACTVIASLQWFFPAVDGWSQRGRCAPCCLLGRQSQKGCTECPCERHGLGQLALPCACRWISAADVSMLLWSGIVANGVFQLFSVDCSLGLRLQALLKQ